MTVITRFSVQPLLLCLLKMCCFLEGALAVVVCSLSAAPIAEVANLFTGLELIYVEVLWAQFSIGVTVILFTFTGALVSTHVLEHHYVTSVRGTHIVWNTLSVILIAYIMEVSSVTSEVTGLAHEELHRSMMQGLSQYLADEKWQVRFNVIHQRLHCCGVDDFEDWLEKTWIPLELLKVAFIKKGRLHPNGRFQDPVIPASCCNPSSPGPCFHDFLQQGPQVTLETIVSSVFTKGCVPAAEEHFKFAIGPFRIISSIICIIQGVQIIIANALYSLRETE